MNLIINGLNVSSWVNRRRHYTSTVTVEGTGGGVRRNGTRIVDKRAVKQTLRCIMNPLTEAQYLELDKRCREEHVAVRGDGLPDGASVEMFASMSEAEVRTLGEKRWWTNITLTLEEC